VGRLQPELPESYLHMATLMLPGLPNEHALTRRVIEAIPADRGDYRPDPASRTALDLAWHIAWAENMFLDGIASGEFDHRGAARPASMRNSADVAAWYAERFERNFNRLTKLSAEQLLKVLDYRGMFQQPAAAYLTTAIIHSIHHRGQLSVYLRPMGAKVPSIYGESFDAAQARASAPAQH
jgi:uncharacterized damage-inducible protein DinB